MPLRQCDNKRGLPYGDDSSFARGVEGQLEKDAAVTGVQEFSNPAGDGFIQSQFDFMYFAVQKAQTLVGLEHQHFYHSEIRLSGCHERNFLGPLDAFLWNLSPVLGKRRNIYGYRGYISHSREGVS